jgi:hypothetical protein
MPGRQGGAGPETLLEEKGMKLSEALKTIDQGWVRKRKGYRVQLHRRVNSEFVTDVVPNQEEPPLDSEVAAWRLAWKLSQAAKSHGAEPGDGDMVNIGVVDDEGNPVVFYGTNQPKVLNPTDPEQVE